MSKSVAILAATATLVLGVAVYYLILARKKKVQFEDIFKIYSFKTKITKTVHNCLLQPLMQLLIFPKSTNSVI